MNYSLSLSPGPRISCFQEGCGADNGGTMGAPERAGAGKSAGGT